MFGPPLIFIGLWRLVAGQICRTVTVCTSTATTCTTLGPPQMTISASLPPNNPTTISQCNTGDAQCCNSVVPSTDPAATCTLQLLGIVIQGSGVLVGMGCTPISVIGVGSGVNCDQQPVCCENNDFNGLVNIGCTPISL